jgi:NAD-dependent SIR2 family protein deacetylase
MIDIYCESCGEHYYWEDTIEGVKMTFIHCPKCGSMELRYEENED